MAEVVKLVQGTASGTDMELDLDDGTNYEVKRVFLQTLQDRELWHSPDRGEASLVRVDASERPAQLDIRVLGGSDNDEDGVQDNVVVLRRWLNNAQKAEMEDSIYPVYLELQKDTATNAVQHKIKSGHIDDSLSHYRSERHQGKKQALHVSINAVLAPYGITATPITLQNDMLSSPHFVEDTDADGLADGWVITGTPVTAIATDRWLIGGQCQKVSFDTSTTEGIRQFFATADDDPVVCYVWINRNVGAGGDDISIVLHDGGGVNLETKKFDISSPSGYDKTMTDSQGNIWYRYVVSHDGSGPRGSTDIRFYTYRHSGDATASGTYYVDGAYVEINGTNGTTAPDAWMSARNIDNRGDIQSTSSATENFLNYWDVWGIPGDAPALIQTKFDWTTTVANQNLMYVGKIADGALRAADEISWIEDGEFTTDIESNGTWSQPSDATRTFGQYRRFVDGGGANSAGTIFIAFSGADAQSYLHNPKRVLVLCRSDDVNNVIYAQVIIESTNVWEPVQLQFDNANQWVYLDFGVINLRGLLPLDVEDPANQGGRLQIVVEPKVADKIIDIDAVLLLPTEEDIIINTLKNNDFNPNTIDTYIRGQYKDVINSDAPLDMHRLGTLWESEPGSIMSRFIWAVQEYDSTNLDLEGKHDPTIAAAIKLTIWPRTRHLLGNE